MIDNDIAYRISGLRYRGSIGYRDTRDGIVIVTVAPISGIALAQHYLWVRHFCEVSMFIALDLVLHTTGIPVIFRLL